MLPLVTNKVEAKPPPVLPAQRDSKVQTRPLQLLQATWDVVWTTEAELLFLTQAGDPSLPFPCPFPAPSLHLPCPVPAPPLPHPCPIPAPSLTLP